ncbi:MAG: TetR/AcrR family transcriptional regulator [Ignavibacteriales bacterium]|nr:TetR/AcrR family transcriptional regulator [Ignavibacteriales bacterium]
MGISERKEREKHEKRRLILDKAMQLFVDEGYENVSIRKIAEKIEYSPATIYLYFSDKDEILGNLQKEGFDKFYDFLSKAESETDPVQRVRKLGRMYIKFGLENPEYYDLMFIARAPMKKYIDGLVWTEADKSFLLLRNTVEYAMEKGAIKQGPSLPVAFGLWSLVHGVVSLVNRQRLSEIKDEELGNLIEKSLDEMISGLVKI